MSDYQTILTDVSDKVATIWLNRPERRNSFSAEMTRELNQEFARCEADDGVRAIVVTGAGKYFSAGADLGRGGGTFSRPPRADSTEQPQPAERAEPRRMRTPVIAALNGSAVGLGITLPVSWDIRFAAADAKYGFVFTRRGIVPEAGSTWMLPRLVGVSRAMELLLSGRIFSGTEGAEMGLFSRALPAQDVLPAAQEFARDLAANTSAVSVAATKALVYNALGQDLEESQAIEHQVFRWTGSQADAAEGVTAFLEKRTPQWPLSKVKDYPPML
ncbi:MAG TPA: enoyl-CoA hydratase-related protein [Trebonia sp.]